MNLSVYCETCEKSRFLNQIQAGRCIYCGSIVPDWTEAKRAEEERIRATNLYWQREQSRIRRQIQETKRQTEKAWQLFLASFKRYDSYVYFVQHADLDLIKIGTTTDLRRRFTELSLKEGGNLKLLAAMNGERQDEQALHRMFAPFKAIPALPKDEWFFPEKPIMFFIERFCNRPVTKVDSYA